MRRYRFLCSSAFLAVAAVALAPVSAASLSPLQTYSPLEDIAGLRQTAHAAPFLPGRAVRSTDLRPAAARRRPATLPACTPVSVTFPADVGQPPNQPVMLTAAQVGPPAAFGPLDATGCDIGVYLGPTVNGAVVRYAQIHDANQFGILAVGAKRVTIADVTIFRIGNHDSTGFNPNGVQTGVGIDFENSSGNLEQAYITQYQKNGTAFDFGSNVSIENSSVIGLGPVNFIAQNGIQWYESLVRGGSDVFATANHYDNPNDPIYNGEATGFLVLCTNEKSTATSLANSFSYDNDFNYYISNNTSNGDCLPGYKD